MTVAEDPSNYCFNLLSTTALIKQYIYWLNTVSRHEWQSKRKTSLNRQQQLLGNVWTAGTLEGSPFSESAICSGKGILNKRVNSVKTVNIKSLNCIIFVCFFFIICFAALSSISMGSTWCLLKAYIIQGFKVESVKVNIQELLSPRK